MKYLKENKSTYFLFIGSFDNISICIIACELKDPFDCAIYQPYVLNYIDKPSSQNYFSKDNPKK